MLIGILISIMLNITLVFWYIIFWWKGRCFIHHKISLHLYVLYIFMCRRFRLTKTEHFRTIHQFCWCKLLACPYVPLFLMAWKVLGINYNMKVAFILVLPSLVIIPTISHQKQYCFQKKKILKERLDETRQNTYKWIKFRLLKWQKKKKKMEAVERENSWSITSWHVVEGHLWERKPNNKGNEELTK